MGKQYIIPRKTVGQELKEGDDDDLTPRGGNIGSSVAIAVLVIIIALVVVYLIGKLL